MGRGVLSAACSFCLLASEIWAGMRAAECKVRAKRSADRGLARSGPPAIIERQKAKKRFGSMAYREIAAGL